MTKIIEFKNSKKAPKRPMDFITLNNDREPYKESTESEINSTNQLIVDSLIKELNASLENIARTNKTANVYVAKIRGDFALRIRNHGLKKQLQQHFFNRGIYLDFKYSSFDPWNTFGSVLLFWDSDYSKFRNRLKRRISLIFHRTNYVSVGRK